MITDAPAWMPLATGAVGFAMQHVSELRKGITDNRRANSEIDLKELSAEESSRNAAVKRGTWVNRVGFGVAVICAVILFPALFAWLDDGVTVETVKQKGGQLFGLFPKKEIIEYVRVEGFVILKSYQNMFISIGTFLLGRRAGK